MHMNLRILLLVFSFMSSLIIKAQEKLLLRHPAINNNGTMIAFSYQGDIWTVPSSGGRPTRLTIHEAYESNPVFSPDGKSIAFSGSRYGNNDIYTIPVEGGTPKRLTYHSSQDNISSWSNEGKIIFNNNSRSVFG